ncbi:hypothetical protein ACWDOP_03095 [Nocardia sp. NPDC003693]
MSNPVIDPIVRADLRRLVESEELGASMFGTAERLATDDAQRRAWNALHELEIRTNAGVGAFLDRTGLAIAHANSLASAAGTAGAVGLRVLPYGIQLRAVREGTTRYLPAFHRLAAHYAGSPEAAFFDYVLRHELAIIEFSSNALAHAPGALDPVLRLLDSEVPGVVG